MSFSLLLMNTAIVEKDLEISYSNIINGNYCLVSIKHSVF